MKVTAKENISLDSFLEEKEDTSGIPIGVLKETRNGIAYFELIYDIGSIFDGGGLAADLNERKNPVYAQLKFRQNALVLDFVENIKIIGKIDLTKIPVNKHIAENLGLENNLYEFCMQLYYKGTLKRDKNIIGFEWGDRVYPPSVGCKLANAMNKARWNYNFEINNKKRAVYINSKNIFYLKSNFQEVYGKIVYV